MKLKLNPLVNFKGRQGPILLIVMDGIGLGADQPGNAVSRADTPVLDGLLKHKLSMSLTTHGTAVGLPTDGDMGNSEVGHNALGAGRIIAQGASLVNKAMASGDIYRSQQWLQCVERSLQGGTLHFLGLLSDGNVHSSINHLYALMDAAAEAGITRARFHVLLDGRDVDPQSALRYLGELQTRLDALNLQGNDYQIASGGGRQVITMDRYDANLAMVKAGYDCHVKGIGAKTRCAEDAVRVFYEQQPGGIDQDIPAFVVCDEQGIPLGRIQDGDAVILTNYRGDRAMEISRALERDDFNEFDRGTRPDFYFCSLIEYDGDLHIPKQYLVSPPQIARTMIEYMCAEQLMTFAVSETQKFGHVTYFWNGNRSGYLCEELESYTEIKSDVLPFNQKPEMKASEITAATIELLKQPGMRFGRINFPNGDMVGHTGDFEACKRSVEVVDACVGELIESVNVLGGVTLVTADHGNAEEMFFEKDGKRAIKTSHTLNPVPFAIVDAAFSGEYWIRDDLACPGLVNVASTVFNLMGYEAPQDYEPGLLEFKA